MHQKLIFATALVVAIFPLRGVPIILSSPAATATAATGKVSAVLRRALDDAAGGVATWVFFTDKGSDLDAKLREAEAALTPHARARRARNRGEHNVVDRYDIPVSPTYIETLRGHAVRIRHTSRWLNAVSIEMDPRAIDAIAALPFVDRMDLVRSGSGPLPEYEDATLAPVPPSSSAATLNYGGSLTQNSQINVVPLHDYGYRGRGVWICMMDTGFNYQNHVAFQNLDVLATYDFVNGDSVVADEVGQMGNDDHGTETLSTIGGYAPGNLIGPAFGATYILAKTENTTWERHVEEDDWVAAAEWADSIGADIISSSLSYLDGFTNGEADYSWTDMDGNTTIVTIGADIAASRGILVCNSAGNNGPVSLPANSIGGPADGDSVFAVGAVDLNGTKAGFSSVGPSADGRMKPDVMAMGVNVRVASPLNPTGYGLLSGTSFSCPLVAGAAALVLDARPGATNLEIMDALRATASQSGSPNRDYGWGIIDAAAAVDVIATHVAEAPLPDYITLYPAYPNPFNPTTTIRYDLSRTVHVRLTIYDARGALVATLVDATQGPGRKEALWDARNDRGARLASGVYMYRLEAGDVRASRKIVLLK